MGIANIKRKPLIEAHRLSCEIFVVDAYAKRICERLPFNTNISYNEIQQFFQKDLCKKYSSQDIPKVYNELHAQIVILAKNYCKKKPECKKCPLKNQCEFNLS